MPVTGDQQLLKQLNRMALVRQVSIQPGLSRAALADVLEQLRRGASAVSDELSLKFFSHAASRSVMSLVA